MGLNLMQIIMDILPNAHAIKDHFGKNFEQAKTLAEKKGVNGVFSENMSLEDVCNIYTYVLGTRRVGTELLAWLNDKRVKNGDQKEFYHSFNSSIGWQAVRHSDIPYSCNTVVVRLVRTKGKNVSIDRPFDCVTMYPTTDMTDARICAWNEPCSTELLERIWEVTHR